MKFDSKSLCAESVHGSSGQTVLIQQEKKTKTTTNV